jgi:hypothetical protein
MADSIIGAPLSKDVHDQILLRQEKVRSPQRDNNTLFFLNSNNAWIKLSSGADTFTVEGESEIPDPTLSKNNILGFTQNKAGVGDLYRETASRGYRPVPGVKQVQVKSKGTYGALRETEVSFVVWSLEDLDTLELVYLRPGFSMLLEWGHTVYFNTAGEFNTASSTINDFFSRYTSTGDKSTQQIIQDKIQVLREQTSYNYDALFGYVKNFSWSFRKDGGYDCTISIASAGSLIEGLRADIGLQNIPSDIVDRKSIEEMKDSLKSPFHFIFEQLEKKNALGARLTRSGNRISLGTLKTNTNPQISKVFERLKVSDKTYVYGRKVTTFSLLGIINKRESEYWMHLGMVFDIINNFLTLRNENGKTIELYSGAQDVDNTGDYELESKYITTKYHFSIDPFRVHLPFAAEVPSGLIGLSENVGKFLGRIPSETSLLGKAKPLFSNLFEPPRGQNDDILNIAVSSIVLQELFDRNLEEPDSQNRDLKSILDSLASILTDHLGGVNEFAFHYDEQRNLHLLVDRKNTPTEKSITQFPVITLTGLSSTVESVSLSSKLSNKVGTQIAIAAQGSGQNYQENVSEFLKWNEGVVDRHGVGGTYDTGDATQVVDTVAEEYARKTKWLELAAEVYRTNGSQDSYDSAQYSELKSYHRIYNSDYVLATQQILGNAEKGIIPVELSFTMMGISGIDIAESFKVSKGILPTKYYGKFGFIITGLEHSIGLKWTTTIKTQFYILEPPSEEQKQKITTRINPARPAGYVNSWTGNTSTTQTGSPSGGRVSQGAVNPFTGPTPNADFLRGVLKSLGYLEKGTELSNGGDITLETAKYSAAVAQRIKQVSPSLVLTFTGGNDIYHQNLNYTSRHTLGRGVDFVISSPTTANINLIVAQLDNFVLANLPFARYLDEYSSATSAATGGHFHLSWGDGTEGQAAVNRAKKRGGAGVLAPIFFVT